MGADPLMAVQMEETSGILVTRREGSFAGYRFFVTLWANAQGHCAVDRIEVDDHPPHKVNEWTLFESIEEAYLHGVEIAKQVINGR
jgi:hypothetical protein